MHSGFPIGFRATLYEQTVKNLKTSEQSFQMEREQPDKHQIPRKKEGTRTLSDMIMHLEKKKLLKFLYNQAFEIISMTSM